MPSTTRNATSHEVWNAIDSSLAQQAELAAHVREATAFDVSAFETRDRDDSADPFDYAMRKQALRCRVIA